MKTLKGLIRTSRVQSNYDNPTPIEITLVDQLSGCEVVSCRMSLEAFAEIAIGSRMMPCDFDVNDSGIVGKRREIKHEIIPKKDFGFNSVKAAPKVRKLLATYETDGWQAKDYDYTNPHNRCDGGMSVLFERWVDVDAEKGGAKP